MAYVTLDSAKLANNYKFLDNKFKELEIDWAPVTKLLCGNTLLMKEVLKHKPREVCDARLSNLILVKELDPSVKTVYIKPPAKEIIEDVVRYADASLNSSYTTIKELSKEAVKQDKVHHVVIMIELGDLREGIMGERLVDFYQKIFELPNIKITGLGSNLNCLYGVMPSEDKLIQLSLYKQLLEAKFKVDIPWVTGGTSVVIPLLLHHRLPAGINHFRVGETLFFGADLVNGTVIEGMHGDVFRLFAQVIEITEKPKVPIGTLETNPSGESFQIKEEDYGQTAQRMILDVGLLDLSTDFVTPLDDNLSISGASSDMLVLEIGDKAKKYKVGDFVEFEMKYMGALRLFNSDYIEKRVV
ncbi:MAG: alanine racemase [Luteibaculum sp.]